jgi:hypothetical protein
MKALLVSRPGRMKKRRSEQRRVIMYRRPGTMARGSDMPRLSATAVRKLLTAGKYLVPIALEDPDTGPQHRGRL